MHDLRAHQFSARQIIIYVNGNFSIKRIATNNVNNYKKITKQNKKKPTNNQKTNQQKQKSKIQTKKDKKQNKKNKHLTKQNQNKLLFKF